MSRSLKVILLILFLGILAHRLYYLYYGIANIITTITVFTAVFLIFDFMFRAAFKLKWKKSNFRLTYWAVLIGILILEFSIRFYFKQNVQQSEKTFFGNYYSPYRNILLENKLRIKDGDMNVGLRINAPNTERKEQNSEFNYSHTYNSFGLRSPTYSKEKMDNSFKILGLGDSFTEGVGTSQDSTWVQLLTKKMIEKDSSVIGINGGFRGSDLFFELYKLENFLTPSIKPDLVILAINETEINDVLIRGGMERFISHKKVKYNNPPWWEFIYSFSFSVRFVIHNLLHMDWHFKTKQAFETAKIEAMTDICNCIRNNFIPLSIKNKFEFVAVYIPMQHEVELNWTTFKDCNKELNEAGINSIDLLSSYKEIGENVGDYYWLRDRHLNSKGYQYLTESIEDEIYKLILEQKSKPKTSLN